MPNDTESSSSGTPAALERLDTRFTRVEDQINQLGDQVSKTNANVQALVEIGRAQELRIGRVENQSDSHNKVNWAPFGILATLFGLAIVSGASLVTFAINAESSVRTTQNEYVTSALLTLHDDFEGHQTRQHADAVTDAYNRGRDERDIAENSHELDLLWQQFFDVLEWKGTAIENLRYLDKRYHATSASGNELNE